MMRAAILTAFGVLAMTLVTVVDAADIGVIPKKLIVVDKLAVAGQAKVVYVSKDQAAGITKGTGADPAQISVQFDVVYGNGSAAGAFTLPAGVHGGSDGWKVNKPTVAKYVNKNAPSGPTQAKVAVVKTIRLLKLVGKGLGDVPLDIFGAGDPGAEGVRTAFCVTNSGAETCHCSAFTGCTYKLIAAGTGAKLLCKAGASDAACSALGPPTVPAGTPDPLFGSGGIVTTGIGSGSEDVAFALVQQADEKLVVAGRTRASIFSPFDFGLVRYLPDGNLDGTFGSGGIVKTSIGSSTDDPYALVQQADGKLVAAGSAWNGSDFDLALVRYLADGSLDGTFGSGGIVTTPIGSGQENAYALVQQADGKLVVAGYAGSNPDFALVRYLADGSLDGTFGSGGIVTTPIGSSEDFAQALVQQADGKFVAAGATLNGGNNDFALVRYQN